MDVGMRAIRTRVCLLLLAKHQAAGMIRAERRAACIKLLAEIDQLTAEIRSDTGRIGGTA